MYWISCTSVWSWLVCRHLDHSETASLLLCDCINYVSFVLILLCISWNNLCLIFSLFDLAWLSMSSTLFHVKHIYLRSKLIILRISLLCMIKIKLIVESWEIVNILLMHDLTSANFIKTLIFSLLIHAILHLYQFISQFNLVLLDHIFHTQELIVELILFNIVLIVIKLTLRVTSSNLMHYHLIISSWFCWCPCWVNHRVGIIRLFVFWDLFQC